jgi:CBS domain-containing membrane protein
MSEIKSENLVFVSPDDDLRTLLSCFQVNKISHVPVVRDKKVVGMISKTDVVECLYQLVLNKGSETLETLSQNTLAKEIMIQPTVQADINDSESMILEKLIQHQVSSVILKREGQIAGIVTEKDMLQYLADKHQSETLNITETMGLHLVEWMEKKGLLRLSRMLADIGI